MKALQQSGATETSLKFATPAEAVRAMADRGSRFRLVPRDDGLPHFVYEMEGGSTPADLEYCRTLLRWAKSRSSPYWHGFRCEVMKIAEAPHATRR